MLLKVQLVPGASEGSDFGGWTIFEDIHDALWTDRCQVAYDDLCDIQPAATGGTRHWPLWVADRYHHMVEADATIGDPDQPATETDPPGFIPGAVIVAATWTDSDGKTHVLHASGQVFLMNDEGKTVERI